MMKKIQAGIIGASGYAGAELVRLLFNHPMVEISGISSKSYTGKKISDLYPGFYQVIDMEFTDEDSVIAKSDVVFASLPHGLSEPLARKCFDAKKRFIDLGADFRLKQEEDYQTWYQLSYQEPQLHKESVYGLPELFRKEIKGKKIIGNPGCYPTSIALGLAPLMKANLAENEPIIIDSKSGTTGAGKSLSENTHFPRCNESFAPYKIATHRHTPEIEQTLSILSNQDTKVSFTPHLLPINRGIISTMYVKLKEQQTVEQLHAQYVAFYQAEPFVRVLPLGKTADLKYVKYSNYCDISVHFDKRCQCAIIVSCIDNMVKGAAGQAIQNMNILFDLEESMGLTMVAPSF